MKMIHEQETREVVMLAFRAIKFGEAELLKAVPEMEIACKGMHILINSSTPMALLSSVLREFDHA